MVQLQCSQLPIINLWPRRCTVILLTSSSSASLSFCEKQFTQLWRSQLLNIMYWKCSGRGVWVYFEQQTFSLSSHIIISKWYFDHIFKYFFSYLRALSPSSWGPSYCVSASLLFLSHCALNRIPLVLIKCHLIIDLPFLFFFLPIVFCDFRSLQFTCNERAVCIHSSWSSLNWTVNFHQLIRSLIMFYPIEINLTYM